MMQDIDQRRRREWASVAVSFVLLLLASTYVTRLMVDAWNTEGFVYYTWWTLVETTAVSNEAAITFPAGILVGWLVLFLLDEYKRVQAVLLSIAAVPTFLWTLFRLEQWVWMEPVAALPGLVAGTAFGVLTGLVGGRTPLAGHDRWTFPTAARALSVVVVVGTVVAFLERYVPYRFAVDPPDSGLPSVVGAGPTATPPGAVAAALDGAIVLLVVGVVNHFVQYSDRKDIVLICPDDRTLVSLLGGMYELARERYDGTTVSGRRTLNDAAAAVSEQQLPNAASSLSFQYRLPGPLKRRTIVSADKARQLTERDVDLIEAKVRKRDNPAVRNLHALRGHVVGLLPRRIRRGFSPSYATTAEQIEDADVVLLVAPLADRVDERRLREGEFENYEEVLRERPEYVEDYERICRAYRGVKPDVYIVVPDGELAVDLYQARSGGRPSVVSPQVADFVSNSLLDVDVHCDVRIVTRPFDDPEREPAGFDRLLTEI